MGLSSESLSIQIETPGKLSSYAVENQLARWDHGGTGGTYDSFIFKRSKHLDRK